MYDFYIKDGLIYKYNALCIPEGKRIQLIIEAHTLKIVEHFQFGKILENLQRYVYWLNIEFYNHKI